MAITHEFTTPGKGRIVMRAAMAKSVPEETMVYLQADVDELLTLVNAAIDAGKAELATVREVHAKLIEALKDVTMFTALVKRKVLCEETPETFRQFNHTHSKIVHLIRRIDDPNFDPHSLRQRQEHQERSGNSL